SLIIYSTIGLKRFKNLSIPENTVIDDFIESWIFPYRTAVLWMNRLAGIATLLGLFGTVIGIQTAFADMELSQNISPDTFARGINEALITTVAGLAMAIPGTALHYLFRDLYEKAESLLLNKRTVE
ncbi:MAG: MotA/TolQ/ExbB proton channel family protein, partial [Leptonema sp. (in: Bacteria)]|nr:MotA/TolQ/ExbB proton channel family protein [Leptonema sp. (in: bacteria)]